MIERIPPKYRMAIYLFTGIMSPIVAVLTMPDIHILPYWFSLIWAGEVTFAGTLAGSNVSKPEN